MVYNLFYTQTAEKDLNLLPKNLAPRIVKKLGEYSKREAPLKVPKKLNSFKTPTYRFRISDYRAIFRLDPKTKQLVILVILKIAHRKEAYE